MKVTHTRLLEGAQAARGVAVIIDVFRAFTCAPLLFSLGIQKSILVSTPEEAFAEALAEAKKEPFDQSPHKRGVERAVKARAYAAEHGVPIGVAILKVREWDDDEK